MPQSRKSEGAFAASGTCLVVEGDRNAWFGTGGAGCCLVLPIRRPRSNLDRPRDADRRGQSRRRAYSRWPSRSRNGVAVGGDYKRPRAGRPRLSRERRTADGPGRPPKSPAPGGYRSAVAFVPGTHGPTVVAAGPTGSDRRPTAARHGPRWVRWGFTPAGFAGPIDGGWGVGEDGIIARWRGRHRRSLSAGPREVGDLPATGRWRAPLVRYTRGCAGHRAQPSRRPPARAGRRARGTTGLAH